MPRASGGPAPAYLSDKISTELAEKLESSTYALHRFQPRRGVYETDTVDLFYKFRGVFIQETLKTGARKPNFTTLQTLKRAGLALAGASCVFAQDFTMKVLAFNALSAWLAACTFAHEDFAMTHWYATTMTDFAADLAADAMQLGMVRAEPRPASPPAGVAL